MKKFALALALVLFAPWSALAGSFEFSPGFSYSRTSYGDGSYSWTRRWGVSLGYYFSERSQIELSYQDVVNRNKISGYEDTTFHDQIYSINWVQSILGKDYIVDPYFKFGAGQLNRDATGSYAFGGSPNAQVDSLTVILGAGVRINFSRRMGLRVEGNTYLTGGSIASWKDNVAFNFGGAFYF
jgi:hypothetical protein